jgi:hypothetical protein
MMFVNVRNYSSNNYKVEKNEEPRDDGLGN